MKIGPRRRVAVAVAAGIAVTTAGASALHAVGTTVTTGASDTAADLDRLAATADPAQLATAASLGVDAEVTLLTGDRVRLGADSDRHLVVEHVTAAPRSDGAAVGFQTFRHGDDLYVLPSDTLSLLATDRLDRELFNVSYLASQLGADGSTADQLPVIVQYAGGTADRRLTARAEALPASTREHTLESIDAAALTVNPAKARSFWSAVSSPGRGARTMALTGDIDRIWLDREVEVDLDESVPQVGAPEAWAAGYDGTGTTVAVLDTGIDTDHPDAADRVVATQSFIPNVDTVADGHGHGTHVASTIAGSGAASDGTFKGIAPGADLMVGKVLSDGGSGATSGVIEGMEWAAASGADVVSMSLGSPATDGTDPASTAVNALSAQYGTLFVIAAGNSGPSTGTVGAPGAAESALTVAAVDKSDVLAGFSSRGPRIGDLGLKPDLAAPGVSITAARAAGTAMGAPVDDHYTSASGTSMATPHVAGAAAILAQQHPGWTGQQLKGALTGTAKDVGNATHEVGTGRLDVAHAVDEDVFGDGAVDFGQLPFPQSGPVTETLTLTNEGTEPTTLDLTATFTTFAGEPAPDGVLTLADDEVTVPAGGSADVTLTLDPSRGEVGGLYRGMVRAADASGTRVTSVVGAYIEPESFDLTVEAVAPKGATDFTIDGWLVVRNEGWIDFVSNMVTLPGQTEVTARLPKGDYTVATLASWLDSDGERNYALANDPQVPLAGDHTARFDLRQAKKVTVETPRPTEGYASWFGFERSGPSDIWGMTGDVQAPYGEQNYWVLPGTEAPSGTLTFSSTHLRGPRLVSMHQVGGGELSPRYRSADLDVPRLTGHRPMRVIDAGDGLPEDFDGLDADGALVLLTPTDVCTETCTDEVVERVAHAAEAGARGVLLAGAVGRVSLGDHDFAVPTLSLPAPEAVDLAESIERRPVKVRYQGTTDVPYLYALRFAEQGRMPGDVDHEVDDDDLTRVDQYLHAEEPGSTALDWVTFPTDADAAGGLTTPTVAKQRILPIYVQPDDAVVHKMATDDTVDWTPPETGYHTFGDRSRHEVHWNARPIVPGPQQLPAGLPDGVRLVCSGCRELNIFYQILFFTTATASHERGHLGLASPVNSLTCDEPGRPPNRPADAPLFQCEVSLTNADGEELVPRIINSPIQIPGLPPRSATESKKEGSR